MNDSNPTPAKRGPGRPRKTPPLTEGGVTSLPEGTLVGGGDPPESVVPLNAAKPERDRLRELAVELGDGRSVLELRHGVGVCLRRYSTPEAALQGADEINAILLQQANAATQAAFTVEVL